MYEAFYRLIGPPFRLTPDPRFLFLSAHHHEALGHLLFGIREGTGFITVTGEIGTGKTTLLRALLRALDPDTIVAYIFNPVLSDLELLQPYLFVILTFFLGLAWGYVTQRTDSLLGSVLFHAGTDIPIIISIFSTLL